MGALLISVEKIVRIIDYGQVYECVFTAERTPSSLGNLQSALLKLYGAVLQLLANSSELFRKGTAGRTIHALLHPGQTVELVSDLIKLEDELHREVLACQSEAGAMADDLLQRLFGQIEGRIRTLLEKVDEKEQSEILNWISSVPYGDHQNTIKEARIPNTCEWLLQHQCFREWEDASSSMIIWLQGSRKYLLQIHNSSNSWL